MEKPNASLFDQLRKEAEQGNAQAQYALGGAYYNGKGVARDPVEGAKWLLKAAEQGYAPAQCDLGAMYEKGVGVEQSYQDTLKWFPKAAEQGDILAQHNLGTIYARGFRDKSVGFFYRVALANATVDRVEAYKWFSLAANKGFDRSIKDRAFIAKRMTEHQIARAQQLVLEFEQEKKTK
jgi:TPR repeat protein